MLILSLAPFRPTAHIGVDRIRPNVLPTTRRRSCYARFGRCERGLAKYTRCVSVAARGVASSLLCAVSTAGRLVWGHRHPASFVLFLIRATIPLPSLCGILYTVPSPICLSRFLALSFSSFVFVLSFGAFGRVSDERTLKQLYTSMLLYSQTQGDVIIAKLRNRCKGKGYRYQNKNVSFLKIFFKECKNYPFYTHTHAYAHTHYLFRMINNLTNSVIFHIAL